MTIKDKRRYLLAGAMAAVGAAVVAGFAWPHTTRGSIPSAFESAKVTVTSSGSLPKDHHTLRVVSANADLTGKRELAWVADGGTRVGDARCTQNFRIGPSASPRVRPTLLICWRTSAHRSVYTVAVDVDHKPLPESSVKVIDDVWARMN